MVASWRINQAKFRRAVMIIMFKRVASQKNFTGILLSQGLGPPRRRVHAYLSWPSLEPKSASVQVVTGLQCKKHC